jgi:hypothetical protein
LSAFCYYEEDSKHQIVLGDEKGNMQSLDLSSVLEKYNFPKISDVSKNDLSFNCKRKLKQNCEQLYPALLKE